MSGVRVLVGTRKGAFILTSDARREKWEISGPHFAGWEIYHLKGSTVDPNRLYASQTSGWFGQIIQRSDDGGKTWHQPGSKPGAPTTSPDGMPIGESNNFVYDTVGCASHHAPVLRRYTTSVGVQARLVSRALADRSGHGIRRGGRRRAFPHDRWRTIVARASWAARPGLGPPMDARRRWTGSAQDPAGRQKPRTDVHRHLGGGRVPK